MPRDSGEARAACVPVRRAVLAERGSSVGRLRQVLKRRLPAAQACSASAAPTSKSTLVGASLSPAS